MAATIRTASQYRLVKKIFMLHLGLPGRAGAVHSIIKMFKFNKRGHSIPPRRWQNQLVRRAISKIENFGGSALANQKLKKALIPSLINRNLQEG